MRKKGEFVWSRLANIILVLVVLIVLLVGVYLFRDYMYELWKKITGFIRFGK